MPYIQKNHPFPVTSCGRRRSFATTDSPIKMYDNSPMLKREKPHTSWTQSDRDKYNEETGSNLKPPQPEGGKRKKSYCARSAGIKKCKNPDKNGDCPNDIARRKWKC